MEASTVVCRGRDEGYLGSLSIVLSGVTDPRTLEFLACHEALALAEDLSLLKFVIACNSKNVVDDMKEDKGGAYICVYCQRV